MIEVLASVAVGVLGWAGQRLLSKVDKIHDRLGEMDGRLIRVETSLTNDIPHSLAELRNDYQELRDEIHSIRASLIASRPAEAPPD